MKSLVTVEAVTHTHTPILLVEIARNSKTFCVFENERNLKYNRNLFATML